jgi:DNA-binding CsgD family transcriptional regulator
VVELVAQELSYQEIAERLNISVRTVWSHIEAASAKIPGTLKPKARIVCWWRGAPRQVLS